MRIPSFPRMLDDVTVRIVAGEVLLVAVIAALTRRPWLFAVLAVDFVLRTGLGPKASPLALLAGKVIRPRVPTAPRPTPGPPKRFAAAVGTVFTIAIPAVYYGAGGTVGHDIAWVLIAIMLVFPALEAFLGLCVGCRVFSLLMRFGLIPEEVCLECADISLRQKRLGAQA